MNDQVKPQEKPILKTEIIEQVEKRLLLQITAARVVDLHNGLLELQAAIQSKREELEQMDKDYLIGMGRISEMREFKKLLEEEIH